MDELGPALTAFLLAASAAAGVLRRRLLTLQCLTLAGALLLALAGQPGMVGLVSAVAAAAPLVSVLDRRTGRGRSSAAVCGGLIAALTIAALAEDPFRDPTCRFDCGANPLALTHFAAASAVTDVVLVTVGLLTAYEGTRTRWPVGAIAGLMTVGATLDRVPPDWALVAAACITLVRGGREILSAVEARGRLADAATALERSQDVTVALRERLRDASLSIAFVLPDGSVIGGDGREAPAVPAGRRVDTVTIGGSTVARISHATETTPGTLAGALSGGARVALDNARLVAVSRLNGRQLRESRARVVNSSRQERRLLERDLHDGAQQEVLSLGLALGDELARSTDPHATRALESGIARIHLVLGSLRELAHGLRPAGVSAGGLSIALEAVADRARVPVDVAALPSEPLPAGVVSAIAGLVSSLASAASGPVQVDVSLDADRILTMVRGGARPVQFEVDRFTALGGDLVWDGSSVRATLPSGVP